MKKYIIACLFCFLTLTGCSTEKVKVISAESAVERIDNKESFVIVVGSTTCHACQSFQPVLEAIVDNYEDLPIFKIYIDDEDPISVEGQKEQVRVNFQELQEKTESMPSTPTTLFIKDGEVADRMVGNKEYSKVIAKLQSTGFISK